LNVPTGDAGPAGNDGPTGDAGPARGRYFYIDISHADYWRTQTLTAVLFPLTEIAFLVLVFYIRRLYLRNREYREKIEAQHNLVVLGTAAGTLAHEIKNPLLSIRLQTGILEKITGESGGDELGIINQEVDRLSSLVYRVNDYLREPEGERSPFSLADLAAETGTRLFGKNIIAQKPESAVVINADENRIRSVLENIFRNAVDSGSPLDDIGASVDIEGGKGIVRIFDRGRGIAEKDLKRVFDPFFTTKSTGTGIGLAVSKRFTEAAGGSIGIENRGASSGGGLMVTLIFPLYTDNGSGT
jgi:two-component system sensor histidine kinase HydH